MKINLTESQFNDLFEEISQTHLRNLDSSLKQNAKSIKSQNDISGFLLESIVDVYSTSMRATYESLKEILLRLQAFDI